MAHFYGFSLPPILLGTSVGFGGTTAGKCLMYVRFTDMRGRPLKGQRVMFFEPPNTPIEGPEFEIETDVMGYASIELEVGKEIEVSFIGTSFMRRITVPAQSQADILEVANVSGYDAFAIVRPDPVPAIRRS